MNNFKNSLAWVSDRYQAMFGQLGPRYDQLFLSLAEPVLAEISHSDAPYHTVEYTLQTIWVGQLILEGKQYYGGSVSPHDWLQFLIALLCHDVGYVKGIFAQDRCDLSLYWNGKCGWTNIPSAATGAALEGSHVDRSKAYVSSHLNHPHLDFAALQWNIEMTRFPIPHQADYRDNESYGGLCRAADLIGQSSDPEYLQKLPLLFQEFEASGINQTLGYESPEALQAHHPSFCWHVVYPYIKTSLRYLTVTSSGRKCIARLYTNLCLAEMNQPPSDVSATQLRQMRDEADFLRWQEAGFTFS